jgi:hypothetical protein
MRADEAAPTKKERASPSDLNPLILFWAFVFIMSDSVNEIKGGVCFLRYG